MRLKAGIAVIAASTFALTALAVGCGGGGGDDGSNPTPTPTPTPTGTPTSVPATPTRVTATINWGPRSRVEGLSSALSAVIRLVGGKSGGGDLVFTANRDAASTNLRQSYTSDEEGLTGKYLLIVNFYAEPNGGGAKVGVAQASATVLPNGELNATIATIGTIRSVKVDAGQSVKVGETKQLVYTPFDIDGNMIAVSPGTALVTIPNTGDNAYLGLNGDLLIGKRPPSARVVVAIDSVSSPATPIIVTSDALVTITPSDPALTVISWEESLQFSATVANAPEDGTVTWSLEGAPAGVTISPTGLVKVGKTDGTFSVVATSNYDTNKVTKVTAKVESKVAVIVAPNPATVGVTDKITFTVTDVTHTTNKAVKWSVKEGSTGGSISSAGVYTAPKVKGVYTVVATSVYDPTKFVEVPVTVEAGDVPVVIE